MSKLFWAMLSFISRLPVPARWSQGLDFEHYSRGIVMFPLIGVVLGGLTGLVFMALQPWCGIPLAALFAVLTLALLTGGFHLDGLADTCDGIFSARRRERMLEIMRDSRLGTHGGLALIFVLLAKVLVVSELALRGTPMLAALAAACVAGRGTAVLLMYRHRYAREEGLGNVFYWQSHRASNLRYVGISGDPCRRATSRHARRGSAGCHNSGDFYSWAVIKTHVGWANRRYAGRCH